MVSSFFFLGLLTHMEHMRMDPKHQFAAQYVLSRAAAERRERETLLAAVSASAASSSGLLSLTGMGGGGGEFYFRLFLFFYYSRLPFSFFDLMLLFLQRVRVRCARRRAHTATVLPGTVVYLQPVRKRAV